MGIEALIKKHNLSATQAERVRKIWVIGNDVVDMNVNDFLYVKRDLVKYKVRSDYSFKIMDTEEMKKFISSKWCYGYCAWNKHIVLNLDHVLNSSIDEIAETMLHEAAHAVAYHLYRDSGHGKYWKRVSRMFGSSPLAKTPMEPQLAERVASKYKLVVMNYRTKTVELIGTQGRRLKNLSLKWAYGRKDTKGMLWLIKTEDYEKFGLDFEKLAKVAIR